MAKTVLQEVSDMMKESQGGGIPLEGLIKANLYLQLKDNGHNITKEEFDAAWEEGRKKALQDAKE